jgi:predicted AAA+ superfamily ATPase
MNEMNQAAQLLEKMAGLSLYDIFSAGPGQTIAGILDNALAEEPFPQSIPARLFRQLAAWAETSGLPPVGSLWQNFILDQVVLADNSFTRMAATSTAFPGGTLPGLVYKAAGEDLAVLRSIIDVDLSALLSGGDKNRCLALIEEQLEGVPDDQADTTPGNRLGRLKKNLLQKKDWSTARDILGNFHRQAGYGIFCRYHAFRWDGARKILSGIQRPDPVRLEELIGYRDQRNQIVGNTERLLEGLPAGNILLYGDRGTGKSSTVKALVHSFGPRGLRMIEIPRDHLIDYPLILQQIQGTGLRFIIFVDDLSYEECETHYKVLKSVLEGSLQAKPDNVVIYATSNRRHLVREYFEDRQGDVHKSDTLQEKLSLSERFAITVLFLSPDQELYLSIVEGLARQNGITLPSGELHLKALEWEKWNNGRSGRTARQFIDSLKERGHTC